MCESPQTIVMPGWVRPSCGPTTCTMPCSASPSGCSRTPNSAQLRRSVSTWVRETGSAIGLSMSMRRDVVVLGGERQVGAADRAAGQPQAVEGLRAGDLVHEVQVDVEQVGLALGAAHDVGVPDLLGERAAHGTPARSVTLRCRGLASHMSRRQYQCMDNSSGVGVLDKAALVLGRRSRPARRPSPSSSRRPGWPGRPRTGSPSRWSTTGCGPRHCRAGSCSGPRLAELAAAAGEDRLLAAAGPVLAALRDITGESAQLYRRQGDERICVAAAERPAACGTPCRSAPCCR